MVFIDLETFNLCLSFCHNLPWQIGMIKVKDNNIIDRYTRYIKWETDLKISKRAAEITHFSQDKFDKESVPSEEVYPVMRNWLDGANYILGHNVLGFDVYLIKEWYLLNNENPKNLFEKFIDTNCLSKILKLGLGGRPKEKSWLEYQYPVLHHKQKGLKTNLKSMGEEFGIKFDYQNLHSADNDLLLNFEVWKKLLYALDI